MTGKSLHDGNYYRCESYCENMSKEEKEQWAKESHFDPSTVIIKKIKDK